MSNLNTRTSKGVILLVDDTPSDVRALNDFLTGKGFDVCLASSGRAAIQAAVNDPPDIILLDVKMPEMDGYEVCERLKANEDLKSIPVLFIGVLDEKMDKVKGFDVGGADYITKPFQFTEVLARVEAHLTIARISCRFGGGVAAALWLVLWDDRCGPPVILLPCHTEPLKRML